MIERRRHQRHHRPLGPHGAGGRRQPGDALFHGARDPRRRLPHGRGRHRRRGAGAGGAAACRRWCWTCTCRTSTASRSAAPSARDPATASLPVVHLSAAYVRDEDRVDRPERRRRRLHGAPGRAGGAGRHAAGADPRAHGRRPAAPQRAALPRHLRPGAERHRAARRAGPLRRCQPGACCACWGARARTCWASAVSALRAARMAAAGRERTWPRRPTERAPWRGEFPLLRGRRRPGAPGVERLLARRARACASPSRSTCRSATSWSSAGARCWSASRPRARRPSATAAPRTTSSRCCRTSCARRSTPSSAGCTSSSGAAPRPRRPRGSTRSSATSRRRRASSPTSWTCRASTPASCAWTREWTDPAELVTSSIDALARQHRGEAAPGRHRSRPARTRRPGWTRRASSRSSGT